MLVSPPPRRGLGFRPASAQGGTHPAVVATAAIRLLVVGSESEARDEIVRLAATAGVTAQTLEPAEVSQASWAAAGVIVIEAACADQLSALGLARRSDVVLVTSSSPSVSLWAVAVSIGVEQILELPLARLALIDRLADAAAGSGPLGQLIAVVGGCGGAGASTLAVALALSAANDGRQPVLLGTDPWDGGIDVALGAEDVPGPRWPDLASLSGRLPSTAIHEGLPHAHGIRFVSSARRHPAVVGIAALSAVVTAALRTGGPVIVDLPRCASESARWLRGVLDLGVVVCPATVPAALAARALVSELHWGADNSGLALRRGTRRDINDQALAKAVGLPVIVRIPEDSRLSGRQQRGEPPDLGRRKGLAKPCAALWRLAGQRASGAA